MEIKSWSDYWQVFDAFCKTFESNERNFVSEDLREAQLHVNGMTDGWFEFVEGFENTINIYSKQLTNNELELAKKLINYVKIPLTKR